MLGENWKGLWSLHEFGLAWEAALVSPSDAEITWFPLTQIRARPEPRHICQAFKHFLKVSCRNPCPLSREFYTSVLNYRLIDHSADLTSHFPHP